MTDRELMQQVLEDICGAKLCEINSMSSRVEMIRLMDSAITALRKRLAQPERVQLTVRDFVVTVGGVEDAVGRPTYWAEWPNKEQP